MSSDVPTTALSRAARTRGGHPLLTHYGADGARTELSVASFGNWVDKTSNLLEDLDVGPGDLVRLPVLLTRPDHWMALVWPFSLWQSGITAHVDEEDSSSDRLSVVGPRDQATRAAITLGCSLDPWARPLTQVSPGVLDYAADVLAQPDGFGAPCREPGMTAWVDSQGELNLGDLAAVAPSADRRCVTVANARNAIVALAGTVMGGGSLVICEQGVPDPHRIASAEHAHMAS